jgi:hypothetical protein
MIRSGFVDYLTGLSSEKNVVIAESFLLSMFLTCCGKMLLDRLPGVCAVIFPRDLAHWPLTSRVKVKT